jgi:hypothetical protein
LLLVCFQMHFEQFLCAKQWGSLECIVVLRVLGGGRESGDASVFTQNTPDNNPHQQNKA